MSLAITLCRAALGVEAPLITIETDLANGLPAFNIVGLPEKAVQESRDRVRSALLNSGFEFPARRITVNLAPADLPKQGARFDLGIALGVLAASAQIPAESLGQVELLGELTLGGQIRPVAGTIPVAIACKEAGHTLITASAGAGEAALVHDLECLAANHLLQVCAHLSAKQALPAAVKLQTQSTPVKMPDMAEVRGQAHARRAIEVAAAGRHNLLMMGPPGTGKSMLAARLPGILPPLDETEALQSAAVRSVAGVELNPSNWRQRPFRAPHHTSSGVALVGGGSVPRPGEISLAHNGVLFLDELPEFDSRVLDVLREPLETGQIMISRAARSAEFPARFQLIAAMNPCRCGYAGDPRRACAQCTPESAARYQARISGPLRDRIDIQIEVPALQTSELLEPGPPSESSAQIAARVAKAWQTQMQRQSCSNAELQHAELLQHCQLDDHQRSLLSNAIERLGLSARAYHRILRVARTIADLAAQSEIGAAHLSEAIGYRRLDKSA